MLSISPNILKITSKNDDNRHNKESGEVIPLPEDSENIDPKSSNSVIVYGLETTGFGDKIDILQISAVYEEEKFNVYTKPKYPIQEKAAEVNMFFLNYKDELMYNGYVVDSVKLSEGLHMFVNWLEEKVPSPRVLFGHNTRTYDTPILMKALYEHNLTLKFCRLIDGFVDTYSVFKDLVPKKEVGDYKQSSLVFHYFNESYEHHNSIEKVKKLQKLILHVKIPEKFISINFIEPSYFTRKRSYKIMISEKAITDSLARKFSENKISHNDLLSQYRIGGDATLERYLHQIKNGKVLGTKDKKPVSKIVKYLKAI